MPVPVPVPPVVADDVAVDDVPFCWLFPYGSTTEASPIGSGGQPVLIGGAFVPGSTWRNAAMSTPHAIIIAAVRAGPYSARTASSAK